VTAAPSPRERHAEVYARWDALGVHRTGTDADTATAHWLRDAAAGAGFAARLEDFPLRRRTPVAATATLGDGTRLDGVPCFDGGQTPKGGLTAPLGDGEGAIAVLAVPPFDALPAARALDDARHAHRHAAILAVSDATTVLPGLALLNAEAWHAPVGPPVLQLPSEAAAPLAAAAGADVHVDVRFAVDPVTAHNVRVDVPGREAGLDPVVIVTPRSGWWHSTSERGGGIALWLDALRFLADVPPRRPVILLATTGHELGHLGLQHVLDAEEALVAGAHGWLHLGANLGAAQAPALRLQASDAASLELAEAALARHRTPPALTTPVDTPPFGEARDLFAGGARFVSLLGGNGLFHHPADRWPDAVDVARTTDLAFAFREVLAAFAHR
jgi:hypothetical protein